MPRMFFNKGRRIRACGKTVTVGQNGMRFIEANLNPFGTGTIGPKAVRAMIPDGNGSIATSMVLTASYDFTIPASKVFAVIGMTVPGVGTTAGTALGGEYGIYAAFAQANDDFTTSPTYGGATYNEWTAMSTACHAHKKARIVGAALRCFATSNSDNTSGMLTAAISPKLACYWNTTGTTLTYTVGATTCTPTTCNAYIMEEAHACLGPKSGITVRRPYQNCDHEYGNMQARCMGVASADDSTGTTFMSSQGFGAMPMIRISSTTSTASFHVDAVLHLEVEVNPTTWPGFLTTSPVECYWSSIAQYCNANEVVVAGHSFKSRIKQKPKLRKRVSHKRFRKRYFKRRRYGRYRKY